MLNCGLPFITIFNRMSKVVVDWSITNPCYLLNQFDAKLKATTVWRFAFSHACSSLHILCSCHLSAEGNPLINFTYLTSPSDWFRKLVLPSQPISYKTRTKRDLVIRVFPRLTKVVYRYQLWAVISFFFRFSFMFLLAVAIALVFGFYVI